MNDRDAGGNGVRLDIVLVAVLTALSFGASYQPYFFGDELVAPRLAIKHSYSFWPIFRDLLDYKPLFVFYGVEALLAKWQATRLVHAALVAGCMIWINVLLYGVVRNLLSGGRALAWLVIATVLTSRYGVMLYYDYLSGLIELLSTSLLLSLLLAGWRARRADFNWWYAALALLAAVLCMFVHSRYVAGLLAAGFAFAIAEYAGPAARRRIPVIAWALSLGFVPLVLFWAANRAVGTLPLMTGTRPLEWETLWRVLTYCYNVFLGGNYGNGWMWGRYNHLHPVGRILGLGTALSTIALLAVMIWRKGIAWDRRGLAACLLAVAGALICVASLPGSERQEARWMVPVGILVTLIWIVIVKGLWRYVVMAGLLTTNLVYLFSGSHDDMAYVYSSRLASSVAGALNGVTPMGRSGIVVGNLDDAWTIGGGSWVDMGPRQGDTFSKVNLGRRVLIDPFVAGRTVDPALYDFGLIFDGVGPRRTVRYRLVSAATAFVQAGVLDVDSLPAKVVLGNRGSWADWRWSDRPDQVDGAVVLRPGTQGWREVSAADLNGRWVVYRARTAVGAKVPMRLQVNWHAQRDNRFLSTTILVAYPGNSWHSFAALLSAPPDAHVGYVYATLHDGAEGVVELESVVLK